MLRSCVDYVTREAVGGWAQDSARPDGPVSLLVTDNGDLIDRVLANGYRPDLHQAGVGDGRHGFHLRLPHALCPQTRHVIEVRRECDGVALANSPHVLEPAGVFDEAMERRLADALAHEATPAEIDRRVAFLSGQLERLLQLRSPPTSGNETGGNETGGDETGASVPGAVVGRAPAPRALVIDERLPEAGRDAGSNAILSHMRALQRLGYDVTFAPADMAGGEIAGILVRAAPLHGSVEDVLRRQAGRFDLVYLHRLSTATRYAGLVRHHAPKARLVYGVADLHHVRVARQAEAQSRPELLEVSRDLRRAELAAARSADAVITHSIVEAAMLRHLLPADRVHLVPWAVPARPTGVAFARRRGVAFIGGYQHPPNLDAATWLIDEIMPLVWQHDPSIECFLVGSHMPAELRRAAAPGIVPVGRVRDLGPLFDHIRLTVAPLTYGAGVKGKVLDSLAAGVPCVATPVAAEGLELPPILQDCVAETAAGLAALVHRLHDDPAANAAAGAAGVDVVMRLWSEEQVDKTLQDTIKKRKSGALPHTPPGAEPLDLVH